MKNLDNSLASFLEEAELKSLEPKGKGPSNGQDTSFSSAFLIELVHRIKNTLAPIKKFTPLEIMPRCSLWAGGSPSQRLSEPEAAAGLPILE